MPSLKNGNFSLQVNRFVSAKNLKEWDGWMNGWIPALKKYHISQFKKELQVMYRINFSYYLYPTSSVLIPLMLSTLACLW